MQTPMPPTHLECDDDAHEWSEPYNAGMVGASDQVRRATGSRVQRCNRCDTVRLAA